MWHPTANLLHSQHLPGWRTNKPAPLESLDVHAILNKFSLRALLAHPAPATMPCVGDEGQVTLDFPFTFCTMRNQSCVYQAHLSHYLGKLPVENKDCLKKAWKSPNGKKKKGPWQQYTTKQDGQLDHLSVDTFLIVYKSVGTFCQMTCFCLSVVHWTWCRLVWVNGWVWPKLQTTLCFKCLFLFWHFIYFSLLCIILIIMYTHLT